MGEPSLVGWLGGVLPSSLSLVPCSLWGDSLWGGVVAMPVPSPGPAALPGAAGPCGWVS